MQDREGRLGELLPIRTMTRAEPPSWPRRCLFILDVASEVGLTLVDRRNVRPFAMSCGAVVTGLLSVLSARVCSFLSSSASGTTTISLHVAKDAGVGLGAPIIVGLNP
jgi:hypothetical protein